MTVMDSKATRPRVSGAQSLMRSFAERTGITSGRGPGQRYLWTDAYAVCTFVGLHRATGGAEHLDLARSLVAAVHLQLGRHRADSVNQGWLSGLSEEDGLRHPTRGGLRIGKPLPERGPGEQYDDQEEWERDGQYFHYLTRWMHALSRMAYATNDPRCLEWAVELAEVAHQAFTYADARSGRRRMYWKMSVDLRRPQVTSMGHHDALDGALTTMELQAALRDFPILGAETKLAGILADFRDMAGSADWTTNDALGIGGLLTGALTLAQSVSRGVVAVDFTVRQLLANALVGIHQLLHQFPFRSGRHRLAFRELGLAIGLHAVPAIAELWQRHRATLGAGLNAVLRDLAELHPLADAIEEFWLRPENRASPTWREHLDIDEVMLATALLPDGYLGT